MQYPNIHDVPYVGEVRKTRRDKYDYNKAKLMFDIEKPLSKDEYHEMVQTRHSFRKDKMNYRFLITICDILGVGTKKFIPVYEFTYRQLADSPLSKPYTIYDNPKGIQKTFYNISLLMPKIFQRDVERGVCIVDFNEENIKHYFDGKITPEKLLQSFYIIRDSYTYIQYLDIFADEKNKANAQPQSSNIENVSDDPVENVSDDPDVSVHKIINSLCHIIQIEDDSLRAQMIEQFNKTNELCKNSIAMKMAIQRCCDTLGYIRN